MFISASSPEDEKNPELGLGGGWPQSAEGKEKVKEIHAKLVEAIKVFLGLRQEDLKNFQQKKKTKK